MATRRTSMELGCGGRLARQHNVQERSSNAAGVWLNYATCEHEARMRQKVGSTTQRASWSSDAAGGWLDRATEEASSTPQGAKFGGVSFVCLLLQEKVYACFVSLFLLDC